MIEADGIEIEAALEFLLVVAADTVGVDQLKSGRICGRNLLSALKR